MRENLSFLIERREIILIKYYILFLTTCYSKLVFIPVYYNYKKFNFSFSNNTWFFGSLVVNFFFFFYWLLNTITLVYVFIVFVNFLG